MKFGVTLFIRRYTASAAAAAVVAAAAAGDAGAGLGLRAGLSWLVRSISSPRRRSSSWEVGRSAGDSLRHSMMRSDTACGWARGGQ